MNLLLLKQLAILSAIIGSVFGAVAILSPLTLITVFLLFGVPAIIILVYMKNNDLIGIMNVREGAIFGSIIGAISFVCAFLVFAPVSIIVSFIYSSFFAQTYLSGFLRMVPFDLGSIFVLFMCVILFASLCALFNGFFGAVTAYAYELITGIKKGNDENNSVDFEIK